MSTVQNEPEKVPDGIKPGQEHTVSIEKLTFGGAGLARIDGQTVFVPGAIPGQTVQICITKNKGRYLESRLVKVIKRAMEEIQPRCEHFHDCGGCTWQNLPYDKQIDYKEQIIRETLEHLTPVDEELRKQLGGRVLKIIPSPQVFHYRNKLEMSFGYETMRAQERNGKRIYLDENPTIGFHQPGNWETVLPVSECHLYDEQIGLLLQDVKRFMQETNLPVYNPKTHKGMLRSLLLRRGVQTGEQMIAFVVKARKKELEPLFQHFMRFGGRSGLASLMVIENHGQGERPEQPKVHTLVGQPSIKERLFDLEFEISPFSFFQTNTLGAEKLYQAIATAADLSQSDIVLDAYCGMGTIGQYLARYCDKVVGIESHPTAIEDALKSAGKNRIANITFYKGRTEQVLSNQVKAGGKYKFSVIVVDPPRAGLHPKAREAMLAHAPEKIVYVSCNMATCARDMGDFLKAGYELRSVQPVDLFPHTAHIETVSVLQKK
ncbi:MAG: 23S rRNA (uracil(1939)-C(5))-methyltransferase RlmD [Candidatus Peribacter sp.]|jgi:23S rRNA (uracil1939-C5)-methyltransferase|nr:23S rRNA (uracil(1939)-C(5))-methyltransferase RlmD [Candidatus Peribacter sp.]MBT4393320.1 23S rRNA (uracil(1939)-C(5))-methyltransferase RlmD [Candidatus Peribacter sp.]MBT4600946.1 23S rRNA (uracil(1939)-C(5))-methyltransferase RlmD [Candidatus Peribacter sp.]MBT5148825.1 23S rRNA (uracil(1939)-C(5))-methyltransferase RlmD [Candidatus Peribacter sp.]MBT5637909.1 23S rRNA (uracil(1939)-C(5))-methyltransferase RlmD [Candidatus Peribacter sp.]